MRKKMTRQERSSDILDDIHGKMGLNSQGKNIYLQLHLNFHLTPATAPLSEAKWCLSEAVLAAWYYKPMQIKPQHIGNNKILPCILSEYPFKLLH